MSPNSSLALVLTLVPAFAWAGAGQWVAESPSILEIEAVNPLTREAAGGSGVVVAPGRIITNEHVVKGRSRVRIRTGPGRPLQDAWVVRSDPLRDLAVLVTTASVQPIEIAPEESFLMDQPVRIVGFPGGRRQITTGMITALLRRDGCRVIQTDAAMAPGNSGGAMLDEQGRLLGISTREILFPENGSRVNEAVHAHEALQLAGILPPRTWSSAGRNPWPAGSFPPAGSGARSRSFPNPEPRSPRPPPVADELPGAGPDDDRPPVFVPEASVYAGPRLGARVEKCFNVFGTLGNAGLKVVRMDPGGAAESGGLRRGDEILTMNDLPIGTALNFSGLLKAMEPGTRVVFQILREGLFREVALLLGGTKLEMAALPAGKAAGAMGGFSPPCRDPRRLGLTVASSSLPAVEGLEVTSVIPGGPANFARLQAGDVITGLNGKGPGNPYDFVLRLHSFRAGTPVQLQIQRRGKTETVTAVIRGG